jgi:hypothetical protein
MGKNIPEHRNREDVKQGRMAFANWLVEEGLQKVRLYIDEVNFNIWCCRSMGRSKIGTNARVIKTASKGSNINVIAMMNSTGLLKFKMYPKVSHVQVNAFLNEVIEEYPEFVVILDNAPAHARCGEVPLK